jgi:protein pelota
MKIIHFNDEIGEMRVRPDSFDDLYLLAIAISPEDMVESESTRKFRADEGDTGEQKKVVIKLSVEKLEVDKNAARLRLTGKIVSGRPEEFVRMGSYHTINVAVGDVIRIWKAEWKDYILNRLRQAVIASGKPRLGVALLDDEKALFAYIRGYGIEIITEIYSKLSKRMSEKDYAAYRKAYFEAILKLISGMDVELVAVAGPGFTKDDFRLYLEGLRDKPVKKIIYAWASDVERSGIREVMQSRELAKFIEGERVAKEFAYLNEFMMQLRLGSATYGADRVIERIKEGRAKTIMVNDSVLGDKDIRKALDEADKNGVGIEIFNSEDDAGIQLRNFGDIAVCAA